MSVSHPILDRSSFPAPPWSCDQSMPRDPPSCGSRSLSCQPFQAQIKYQNSTGVFQTTSTSIGTSRLKVDSECPWGSFCPVYMNYHWRPNANLIPTPTSCPLGLASVLMASAFAQGEKVYNLKPSITMSVKGHRTQRRSFHHPKKWTAPSLRSCLCSPESLLSFLNSASALLKKLLLPETLLCLLIEFFPSRGQELRSCCSASNIKISAQRLHPVSSIKQVMSLIK